MTNFNVAECMICGSEKLYFHSRMDEARTLKCEDCGLLHSRTAGTKNIDDVSGIPLQAVGPVPQTDEISEKFSLNQFKDKNVVEIIFSGVENLSNRKNAVSSKSNVIILDEKILAKWPNKSDGPQSFDDFLKKIPIFSKLMSLADVVFIDDALSRASDPRKILHLCNLLLKTDGLLLARLKISFRKLGSKSKRVLNGDEIFGFDDKNMSSLLFQGWFQNIRFSAIDTTVPFSEGDFRLKAFYPQHSTQCIVSATKKARAERRKVSIILPVFNEVKTVKSSIQRVLDKNLDDIEKELIIVESNSNDGTREIVQKFSSLANVTVVLQENPLGKGFAVREGLEHVTGDFVLIQDGDDEYDVEDYDILLSTLMLGMETFVLGARHTDNGWELRDFKDSPKAAFLMNIGHKFFAMIINVCLGIKLKDPFTMYKVFRSDCIKDMRFFCNRFDFDWEIVIKLVRRGYIPVEIPVSYQARSFSEGKKVRFFYDPLLWFRAIFKCVIGPTP